ncbi:MAG: BMP family ABC transporter substrate-binding protein [Acutalibacteraceae bacterium]|nr:BMP family ABC transporter substrate-binding protein [Acutalibacteraceae bacterium]
MKKFLSAILAAVMLLTLASCGTATTQENEAASNVKVGFIFLHDENSTYDKNFIDAAKAVQSDLGLTDAQVMFKTNIPETNECYEAAAELADAGCNLIFADSFGHEPYMVQAAKEYPEVQFCHATGTTAHTEKLTNFHNAFASIYEGRYLAGIAAGMKVQEMIDTKKITEDKAKMGYVGAFPYAEVISGYTSFFLGARSVCPSVTMEVQYTNSWYDEAMEKEAANSLINSGCVLISQHADSMGAPTACETAGVPNVSYNGSTISACPNTYIISSKISWKPYFKHIIEAVENGTTITEDYCVGITEGAVELSELNTAVAAAGTQEAIDAAKAKFADGTLHVFDTSTFTVKGEKLESHKADVDTDDSFTPDTEAVSDGYFHESEYRSAPYFDIVIDGITVPTAE